MTLCHHLKSLSIGSVCACLFTYLLCLDNLTFLHWTVSWIFKNYLTRRHLCIIIILSYGRKLTDVLGHNAPKVSIFVSFFSLKNICSWICFNFNVTWCVISRHSHDNRAHRHNIKYYRNKTNTSAFMTPAHPVRHFPLDYFGLPNTNVC